MDKTKWVQSLRALIFPLVLIGAFLVSIVVGTSGRDQLEIAAYLEPVGQEWTIKGVVILDGDPVQTGRVWAFLIDDHGNRYAPRGKDLLKEHNGEFEIESVPKSLGGTPVTEIEIHAKTSREGDSEAKTIYGDGILTVSGEHAPRRVSLSMWALTLIPAIFLVSVFLPFVGPPKRIRHIFSIVLACAFTIVMIVYISIGMRYVATMGREDQVISLGFASIYKASFVEQGAKEWLFSFTSPPPDFANEGVTAAVNGFGAPLWVLLLAVVGAALLTMSIIVREIRDRPNYSEISDLRSRDQEIVRHQFFILFAPLGAVFVYQLLVVAEAAKQPLTVAIAVLGAGASLTALLKKAVDRSSELLGRTDTTATVTDGTSQSGGSGSGP